MQEKEQKAAAEKTKAAERKEHSQERRRKSGLGSLLPDLPKISDSEHEADGQPATRSRRRKRADPAREASHASVWIGPLCADCHAGLHPKFCIGPRYMAAECQICAQGFCGEAVA